MTAVYADHVDRATRAAALVLTVPPPSGPELHAVRRLHDDLAVALAEATRLVWLSALGEPRAERDRAGMPTAQEMLSVLDGYPRIAVSARAGWAPSDRWTHRPADLTVDTTSLGAWKVLVAETFLARSALDQMTGRLDTPVRAAVLNDLATIADALATATADLAATGPSATVDRARADSRALAVAASRLQGETAWARDGAVPMPAIPAARERRGVQLVREHTDVAPALANLARLTATGQPHAAELFATMIMLGTVADSVATALGTATRIEGRPDPDRLQEAAVALEEYRRQLSRLLRKHQPRLASIGPRNPAALAQARELRTAGVPTIQALGSDPVLGAWAADDLLRCGAALAPATAVVRAAFSALDQRGRLLAYDWAPGPGFHWRSATTADVEPLIAGLATATRTAGKCAAAQPASHRPSAVSPARPGAAQIVDLTDAIDRRRAALPAPRLTGPSGSEPSPPRAGSGVPARTSRTSSRPISR